LCGGRTGMRGCRCSAVDSAQRAVDSGQFRPAKCPLGGVFYIGEKAAYMVTKRGKWLLKRLRFFET